MELLGTKFGDFAKLKMLHESIKDIKMEVTGPLFKGLDPIDDLQNLSRDSQFIQKIENLSNFLDSKNHFLDDLTTSDIHFAVNATEISTIFRSCPDAIDIMARFENLENLRKKVL